MAPLLGTLRDTATLPVQLLTQLNPHTYYIKWIKLPLFLDSQQIQNEFPLYNPPLEASAQSKSCEKILPRLLPWRAFIPTPEASSHLLHQVIKPSSVTMGVFLLV